MTDDELVQAIKAYDFATHETGAPILPPRTHPLGKRLHYALPSSQGDVSWTLQPGAQAALRAKGFTVVTSDDGERAWLHSSTPRAGKTPQPQMTDAELAQAVRENNFATNKTGAPVLPPGTTPLGQRLRNALVNRNGGLPSALKPEAQAALREKGFTLTTLNSGRTGLHPSTPRSGGTHQPRARGPLVPAAAGPVPGGSRQPTGQTLSLPRMEELNETQSGMFPPSLAAAAAAEPVPGWSGHHTTRSPLPRIPELGPPQRARRL